VPLRICSARACPNPASYRGRCQSHAREYNRETRSANVKVYSSKRWQLTRRSKLFDTPLCERCGTIATDVHHKIDLSAGGDPWALEGLESLCASCHARHTRATQLKEYS
jgi:5-methylcytosine-specific restriction endonuclease McrA